MIDIRRRFFLFGATAALILPPAKTFHILPPPLIIKPQGLILPEHKLFDLPNWQSSEIGRKLIDGTYKLQQIPRWVVLDKKWYDDMVRHEIMTS